MSKWPSPLTLGIDLGTSAVKVELLSAEGLPLATGEGDHPTLGQDGAAEQRPADWDDALVVALSELAAQARERVGDWRERVAAIGVVGQLPTLVCLGEDDVLGTAVTWKDARADAWASTGIQSAERQELYRRTGMPIDGRYLGPMYRFHRSGTPTQTILSAKDYLVWRLTGRRVTDPSTAAGYATYDLDSGVFAEELCQRWGLTIGQMPTIVPATDEAGCVTAAASARFGLPIGVPVTAGAAVLITAALVHGAVTAPATVGQVEDDVSGDVEPSLAVFALHASDDVDHAEVCARGLESGEDHVFRVVFGHAENHATADGGCMVGVWH